MKRDGKGRSEWGTKEARGCRRKKAARERRKRDREKEWRRGEEEGRGTSRLHREGERLRSEPETDELMLETTGGLVLSSV